MNAMELSAIRQRVINAVLAKILAENVLPPNSKRRITLEIIDDAELLIAEVDRVRMAVDEHRRQRGDDRCWQDDDVLYATVFPDSNLPTTALPPRAEFLESCARSCVQFWEKRQRPGTEGAFPHEKTIAQLEAENAKLNAEVVYLRRLTNQD